MFIYLSWIFLILTSILYYIKNISSSEEFNYHFISYIKHIKNYIFYLFQYNNYKKLPIIEKLSPLCIRIICNNPGLMNLQGTNSYIIGNGTNSRILIDTGDGIFSYNYYKNIQNVLQNIKISDILITHGHYDHIHGIHWFIKKYPNIKIWKYIPRLMKSSSDISNELCKYYNIQSIYDGQIFKTNGATIEAIYTPGHTNDHFSFFIKETNELFTGDNVLVGTNGCIIEDLYEYLRSLTILHELNPINIYPGHGGAIFGKELAKQSLQEYKIHREKREKQIMNCLLRAQKDNKLITIHDIMKDIYYNKKSEKKISWCLQFAAMNNVEKHLFKLYKDKKVDYIQNEPIYSALFFPNYLRKRYQTWFLI